MVRVSSVVVNLIAFVVRLIRTYAWLFLNPKTLKSAYLEYTGRIDLDPIDVQFFERVGKDELHFNTSGLDLAFEHSQSALDNVQGLRIYWCDLVIMSNTTPPRPVSNIP